jgi:hypothetical protein
MPMGCDAGRRAWPLRRSEPMFQIGVSTGARVLGLSSSHHRRHEIGTGISLWANLNKLTFPRLDVDKPFNLVLGLLCCSFLRINRTSAKRTPKKLSASFVIVTKTWSPALLMKKVCSVTKVGRACFGLTANSSSSTVLFTENPNIFPMRSANLSHSTCLSFPRSEDCDLLLF